MNELYASVDSLVREECKGAASWLWLVPWVIAAVMGALFLGAASGWGLFS